MTRSLLYGQLDRGRGPRSWQQLTEPIAYEQLWRHLLAKQLPLSLQNLWPDRLLISDVSGDDGEQAIECLFSLPRSRGERPYLVTVTFYQYKIIAVDYLEDRSDNEKEIVSSLAQVIADRDVEIEMSLAPCLSYAYQSGQWPTQHFLDRYPGGWRFVSEHCDWRAPESRHIADVVLRSGLDQGTLQSLSVYRSLNRMLASSRGQELLAKLNINNYLYFARPLIQLR